MTKKITWSRPEERVIEWTVSDDDPDSLDNTMHCNRSATFHGPYDGRFSHQVRGSAKSVWDEDDARVYENLFHKYGGGYRSKVAIEKAA